MGSHNKGLLDVNEVYHTQIVGIYYTGNGYYIKGLPKKSQLDLVPEPENKYDDHAVKVMHEGKKLGYIPKGENRRIFKTIRESKVDVMCLLGKYRPSSSGSKYSSSDSFSPERADITIHTYTSKVEWRPVDFVPEDGMAF
ncbi:MAG: hypothetical protein GF364_07665 [Candidatus Lokiarchaeota archaeon]|nr:hypothetical protein [Candidatus Lokiarchaeota archaeon]